MVFFEALVALFNLDLGFFIDLFLNNLLWFFAFFAFLFILNDGKKSFGKILYFTILYSILFWAFFDFIPLTGLHAVPLTFFLFFVTRVALDKLLLDTKFGKKYFIPITAVHLYGLFLISNFFRW